MKFIRAICCLTMLAWLLSGCNGGSTVRSVFSTNNTADAGSGVAVPSGKPVIARFDTTTGSLDDLPLPDDFLRDPQTGLNNFPGKNVEPTSSFDTIAGFSTAGPILIPFQGVVADSSVNGNTVLIRDTTDGSVPTVSIDNKTGTGGSLVGNRFSTIVIRPLLPLKSGHNYVVVITQGVKSSADGSPVQSSSEMTALKFGEPVANADVEALRKTYQPIWSVAEQMTGVARANIPLAMSFTTQNEFRVLPTMRQTVSGTTPAFTVKGQATTPAAVDAYFSNVGMGGVPHSSVGVVLNGTLTSPAYVSDDQHTISFQNGLPVQLGTFDVPFVATVPLGASGPVPVLIFQHGVTGRKYDALFVANAASLAGFGVIAIDAVSHGDRGDPNLPSGAGFISLNNLRLDRDHIYQTINDIYSETQLVATGNTAFTRAGPLFQSSGMVYVGQSLGAIMGGTFLSTEPRVTAGVLNVGGGKIPEIFANSPTLSTPFLAILGAQGIAQGTPQFDQYMLQAQTVLDDVDPFNYGAHLLAGDLASNVAHRVLMQEMIGDQVVPNANTEALARSIAVTQLDARVVISLLTQANTPFTGSAIYQFTGGAHGFLLDPTAGPTAAAQAQVMQYLTTGVVNAAASKASDGTDWGAHPTVNAEVFFRP